MHYDEILQSINIYTETNKQMIHGNTNNDTSNSFIEDMEFPTLREQGNLAIKSKFK